MRSGAKESSKLVIIPNRKPLKGSLIVLTATNHQALVVEGIQMLSVMIKTSVDKKKRKKITFALAWDLKSEEAKSCLGSTYH